MHARRARFAGAEGRSPRGHFKNEQRGMVGVVLDGLSVFTAPHDDAFGFRERNFLKTAGHEHVVHAAKVVVIFAGPGRVEEIKLCEHAHENEDEENGFGARGAILQWRHDGRVVAPGIRVNRGDGDAKREWYTREMPELADVK